jgi:hypothetical protein
LGEALASNLHNRADIADLVISLLRAKISLNGFHLFSHMLARFALIQRHAKTSLASYYRPQELQKQN